jgi:integrase
MRARRGNGEGTVYLRKDGRWEAAAFVPTSSGRRKRVRTYAASREAARARLVALLDSAQRGLPQPDQAWRVGDYLQYWLNEVIRPTRREKTSELYESTIRLHIAPFMGGTRLSRLSVQRLQRLLTDRAAAGCSPRTIQLIRSILSSALSRAVKEELLSRNVARLLEVPHWQRKDVTPWTVAQVRTFLAAAAGSRYELAFLLLIHYGLRRGEVLGLRWRDIDFAGQTIHIRQQLQRTNAGLRRGPVKTAAGNRDLPLVPSVAAKLRARAETTSPENVTALLASPTLVFRSKTGQPIEPNNLVRAFHAIRQRARLPRISVHYLRHTTATLLKDLGVPARDAQLILGHAHISTTQQLYQHADASGQRRAMGQMSDVLKADQD